MKVYHVLPPNCIVPMLERGIKNVMLLAHESPAKSLMPHRLKGASFMLDYPTYEGVHVHFPSVLRLDATAHGVSAVVLPDSLGCPQTTRSLVREYFERDRAWFEDECVTPIAACQGFTEPELREDLQFYADLGITMVGLPSYTPSPRPVSRLDLMSVVAESGMKVHLLGLSEDPKNLQDYARYDCVVSVDTSRALGWALHHVTPAVWDWWNCLRPPHYAWSDLRFAALPVAVQDIWLMNCGVLERWARGEVL